MHVLIACIYGWTLWFSAMAYTLIVGGPFWVVAACGPFIISGAMAFIWALEYAIRKLHARIKGKSDASA
jgi:hypothetical protein